MPDIEEQKRQFALSLVPYLIASPMSSYDIAYRVTDVTDQVFDRLKHYVVTSSSPVVPTRPLPVDLDEEIPF